ncbi:SUR7-domain-containing protein [Polychaeton citri CBS 116435]|uniref:SUR7-domain-containing protein n=1 Tax=Polychaeton citri CBS 116435 TaxID=1314669 RepID=A0A9P4QH13_9PEZI|nr:SUR7-domain-containing protein [Polychaeton citri CBS 116435]
MAIARPILSIVSLVILAGGIVMAFFVILSGTTYGSPENQIYFLQSTTNRVTGGTDVRNPTRWTFFALCSEVNGKNTDCRSPSPALPFDPPRNFQTQDGVPDAFIGTHHYYYLSRFMFAFYLIAIFFAVVAFFISALALCTRLGAYLTGLTVAIAMFFQALAASLMTAWTVQGRNHFNSSGETAGLGVKAYGFTWAAFACYLICTVLFCVGGSVSKDKSAKKTSYFGRKRSTRSRGSFIDSESQRRVKDEYGSD